MATFHSVEKLSRPSSFFLTVLLAFQLVYPTDGSENTPSLLVAACLKQSNCWLRYRFNYADHWNDCHGDQFLKRTRYDLFVGVVLCSTSRYKLFLSETMYGTYQQVGDSSGRGEDHCEFVNGSELAARTAGFPHKAPKTTGFYRRRWGERPRWGPIGNGPGGRLESTGRYYVKWYECDVNIPGSWAVLDLDAADTRGPSVPTASTTGGAAGVGGPLSFTVTPMNKTVAAGEVVTFECAVNQPGANIAWYFKDADLHTDTSRGVDVDAGVVLITDVTSRDAGEYVCVADGDDDVLAATAYLRVVDTLTREPAPGGRQQCNIAFGRTPTDASKSAGRNHVFRCSPADSTGRVTWWKDGSQLTTTGRIRVLLNGFLRIRRLTLGDSGVYTCVVRPKFGGDCSDAVTAQLAVILDCGRTVEPGRRPVASRRHQGRIVVGTDAPRWAAPWQVALRRRQPPGSFLCGGVLIEHRWVLTAAHCFMAVSSTRTVQPEDVLVDVGESDRGVREPEQVTLGIDMIISHPSFNESTFDNDIALLQLDNRVQFSNYVRPLCLASRQFQEDHFLRPNRTGTVTGWGRLSPHRNSPLASALQEIHVPYVNESVCAASTSYSVTRNMFCAGHRQGQGVRQDACQGDSGGPMSMPHDGKHYLVGLVSWGEGCGAKDKFGFYTKVANYYSWILRSIGTGG